MLSRFVLFDLAIAECFEMAGFASSLVFFGFRKPKAPRLAVKFRLTPLKSFNRDSGRCGDRLPVATGVADIGLDVCTGEL